MFNYKIDRERIEHMHGVAEFMYEHYDQFNCKLLSKEEIYFLGLNHDIGYMYNKDEHETKGANLISKICQGTTPIICHFIALHGITPKEYMEITNYTVDQIPHEMILLWYADLTIEARGYRTGKDVGFETRLKGVKEKYGEDSLPYKIGKQTVDWLIPVLKNLNIDTDL